METQQIRYFLAACETLNFTRAAERCDVAVPTLTKAIHKLEVTLGGHLFRRERHLTHLTDLGRLMQQHFADAQKALDAARSDAERYAGLAAGRLKLGIFSTMPSRHLTGYLRAIAAAAPELDLVLWEAHCEELGDALLRNEIDVAIMSSPEYESRLRAVPLFEEAYFVAFAPGHRFEAMNAVPMRELEGEAYIKRLHCEFPANFARLNVKRPYEGVRVRFVTEREDWVQTMVSAGLGVTLMPEHMPIVPGFLTRRVVEPEVSRKIGIVTVAGRQHSAPVEAAVRAARTMRWDA